MRSVTLGDVSLNCLARGEGPPLLLVHGFPLDHTMWRHQIEGLSDIARVIAPDLRGFGQSSVSEGTVTMEQYADDLHGLLKALDITEPVTFCGLSMGGYIAWPFCRKYSGQLGKLILCDTRAAADTPEAARARMISAEQVLGEGPSQLVEGLMDRLFAPGTSRQSPDVEATRQTMLASPRAGIAAALRGMAGREDASELLPAIQVPTLVIVGQHDVISPAEEMRQIAEAIANSQFVEVPDAGHMAPLESPGVVNTAIREFLP